jgi:fucose permease
MKRNYYIVALIMLTFFVISFITNIFGPITPEIKNGFNLNYVLTAVLYFAFFIAYGVMSIPAGMLIEKYNEKKNDDCRIHRCICRLAALCLVS